MANNIKSNLEYLKEQTNTITLTLNNSIIEGLSNDTYSSTTLCPSSEPSVLIHFYTCYNELLNKIADEMKVINEIGYKFQDLDINMGEQAKKLGMEVTSVVPNTVTGVNYDTNAYFNNNNSNVSSTMPTDNKVSPLGSVNIQSNFPNGNNVNSGGGISSNDYLSFFNNANASLNGLALGSMVGIGSGVIGKPTPTNNLKNIEPNTTITTPVNNPTTTNTNVSNEYIPTSNNNVYNKDESKNTTEDKDEIIEDVDIDNDTSNEEIEEQNQENNEEIIDTNEIEDKNNINVNVSNQNIPINNNDVKAEDNNKSGALKTLAGIGLAAGSAYGAYEYTKKLKEEDEFASEDEEENEEDLGGEE